MKYTVIYNVTLRTGSHWNTLTQFKYIETQGNELLSAAMDREECLDNAVFVFEGHPHLEGP